MIWLWGRAGTSAATGGTYPKEFALLPRSLGCLWGGSKQRSDSAAISKRAEGHTHLTFRSAAVGNPAACRVWMWGRSREGVASALASALRRVRPCPTCLLCPYEAGGTWGSTDTVSQACGITKAVNSDPLPSSGRWRRA